MVLPFLEVGEGLEPRNFSFSTSELKSKKLLSNKKENVEDICVNQIAATYLRGVSQLEAVYFQQKKRQSL